MSMHKKDEAESPVDVQPTTKNQRDRTPHMPRKTTATKPYNTVTADQMRRHTQDEIYQSVSSAKALSEPLAARASELDALRHRPAYTSSHVVNSLLSGEPFDAITVSARIREAHLEHLLLNAENSAIVAALTELRHRLVDWEPHELGELELQYLNEQLAVLIGDVKRIAADHPVELTLDDMQRRPDLAEGLSAQYTACEAWEYIRAQQLRVATRAGHTAPGYREALAVSGRFRNAVEVEEFFLDTRRGREDDALAYQRRAMPRLQMSEERLAFFTDVPEPQWSPMTSPTAAWPDGAGHWEYLVWAAHHTEPWVPGHDELEAQHDLNLQVVVADLPSPERRSR